MCTLTWRRSSKETFEVFFNRDEKKTRSRAEPPGKRLDPSGMRFLSPVDPESEGTWMLANERGVVVCLLNRWHESGREVAVPVMSRGVLVRGMAGMENVPAVEERLRSEPLEHLRPFTLVAFDPVGERGWEWNGLELKTARLELPVTSSSYQFERVMRARQDCFEALTRRGRASTAELEQFHSDTGAGASAFSVRMCRPDAQTMSRSRVRVAPDKVSWDYWEEARDLAELPRASTSVLRRSSAIGG